MNVAPPIISAAGSLGHEPGTEPSVKITTSDFLGPELGIGLGARASPPFATCRAQKSKETSSSSSADRTKPCERHGRFLLGSTEHQFSESSQLTSLTRRQLRFLEDRRDLVEELLLPTLSDF